MRINKIKKYILIPVISILLSVFIPLVSFADTMINVTYGELYGNSNTITSLSDTKPSWYNANYFHIDLTTSSQSINKYWYVRCKWADSSTLSEVFCSFDVGNYNSFTSGYVGVDSSSYLYVWYYDSNGNSIYANNIYFNQQSGSVDDGKLYLIWNSSPVTYTDGNNNTVVFNIVSFSTYVYNTIPNVYSIKFGYGLGISKNYTTSQFEIITPLMNVFASDIGGGGNESSEEVSEETSGGGTSQWQDDLTDQLDEMTELMEDVVGGIGNLSGEVSALGDDISRGFSGLNSAEESRHNELMEEYSRQEAAEESRHNELMEEYSRQESAEESRHNDIMGDDYSTDESAVDNMGLQVSELDNNFSDHDIDLSNGIDNLNSFDESDLFDDIESAFNDLDNVAGHNDMHYTSFVQQLYTTLGIGTYLLFLVPFCMIFVLFKFVLGGVV